jgi:hypothetical protein
MECKYLFGLSLPEGIWQVGQRYFCIRKRSVLPINEGARGGDGMEERLVVIYLQPNL